MSRPAMNDNVLFYASLPEAFASVAMAYPDKNIEPGKLVRFSTNGKPNDTAGWCRLFPDGVGAVFGCHREGTSFSWQQRDSNAPPPSKQERQAAWAKSEQIRQQAERERDAQYAKAAENAARILEKTTEIGPAHSYVTRKGIMPFNARQNGDGFVTLPVFAADGTLQSLQFIGADGVKRFLPQSKMKGGRLFIGKPVNGNPLFLAEGWATACSIHEATRETVVIGFASNNLAVVAADLRQQFPDSPLRVAGDLDTHGKGLECAQAAAAAGGGVVLLPSFADGRNSGDFNDLHQSEGLDSVRSQLSGAPIVSSRETVPFLASPLRFKLLSAADLANTPPMKWMVRGVLPLEGLAALYGPSGSGKSFLVLDVAASIAGGDYDWFGRRVTQCPVTYCALEGEGGMGKRVRAWGKHHKKPLPDTMRFIKQSFDLLNPRDVNDLAKAVQAAGGSGGLVILDTLNRAVPGADENSSVDMGNIIAAAKQLQNLTGGLVLLVHHTGKDATKGLRGHSSLYAALDGAIEVNRIDSRREWSIAKSKDDETGTVHAFKLEIVSLGLDDEGEEITSCVAMADDSREVVKQVKLPSGGNQKIALDVLAEPLRNSREFNKDGAPAGHPCIRLDEAISLVAERMVCESKHKTSRAREAVNGLQARGIYGVKGDWLWRN